MRPKSLIVNPLLQMIEKYYHFPPILLAFVSAR